MKIGAVGMGNRGTAMTRHLARNGHVVIGCEHAGECADKINRSHTHSRYLDGVQPDTKVRSHAGA